MRRRPLLLCLLLAACAHADITATPLSPGDALAVGRKIWRNECGGTVAGLTTWNSGEEFPSLGIAHFIWYPTGYHGPFDESFPRLIAFLRSHGAKPPAWLRENDGCPWPNRAAFLADFDGPRLTSLREFFANTVALQARFTAQRLEDALPRMLKAAPPERHDAIRANFAAVAAVPNGVYALIDYVNFKGEGVLATERYHGEGWGLAQVLQSMEPAPAGKPAVRAFVEAAKAVLARRVRNSPPDRRESRWLPGWNNRLDTYLQ